MGQEIRPPWMTVNLKNPSPPLGRGNMEQGTRPLPPAHAADDLHPAAVLDGGLGPAAAGDGLAVDGDGDLLGVYVERPQEFGNRGRAFQIPGLTVEGNAD